MAGARGEENNLHNFIHLWLGLVYNFQGNLCLTTCGKAHTHAHTHMNVHTQMNMHTLAKPCRHAHHLDGPERFIHVVSGEEVRKIKQSCLSVLVSILIMHMSFFGACCM